MKKPEIKWLSIFVTWLAILTTSAYSQKGVDNLLVISKAPPEIPDDTRNEWNDKLLQLALEKTREEYGPFKLVTTPNMSRARIWKSIHTNRYPNLFLSVPYQKKHVNSSRIHYIPFPVELGFLGYRVCFYPQKYENKIAKAIDNGKFRQLKHGQHRDWEDVDILRHNGYTVEAVTPYESLFRMTAVGRFDLFCRGAAEVFDEYQRYSNLKGLELDQRFAFRYEFPVFYFTNSANTQAIERVHKGLVTSYNDGSINTLFQQHYEDKITFLNLSSRHIVDLENPYLDGIDTRYQQYNIDF